MDAKVSNYTGWQSDVIVDCIAKVAHKYAEQERIAVRNVRRDGMEHLKRAEKDHEMGKDKHTTALDQGADLTDKIIKEIDEALASKEAEIMQV